MIFPHLPQISEMPSFRGAPLGANPEPSLLIRNARVSGQVNWGSDKPAFLQGQKSGFSGMTKEVDGAALRAQIRSIMSDYVGVIRDRAGLERAVAELSPLAAKSDMALVGLMIAQSALRREESRGAHSRSDFPQTLSLGQRSRFSLVDRKDAQCPSPPCRISSSAL